MVLIIALFIFWTSPFQKKNGVDIEVLEFPKLASQVMQITPTKALPKKPKQHEVFGVSRKSLTSETGEIAKAGNTLAKAPDQEKLNVNDPDSIPIPTEDYLITKMPVLKAEIRIPYPPEAKKKGVQGAVIMDILIDSSGRVREVNLVDGPAPDLNSAAVTATKNFLFTPALMQEKAVAVRIRYAYRFVLEH